MEFTLLTDVKIAPKGTNVTGMYRKCQTLDGLCETLVSCPYVMCSEHWTAKAMKEHSSMNEIRQSVP